MRTGSLSHRHLGEIWLGDNLLARSLKARPRQDRGGGHSGQAGPQSGSLKPWRLEVSGQDGCRDKLSAREVEDTWVLFTAPWGLDHNLANL